jgi:surface carbohydrate biosynthesis protein
VAAALQRFRPQIVALPFCYSNSLEDYPFLLDWPRATYFNLAWEELFYEGNREAKLPSGEFECKQVIHHAWGDFFVDLLLERGVPRQHIFLNGHPVYTLYAEPYRQYFVTRAELAQRHGLDPARRWVFFPENYNWAFYAGWKLESLERSGLKREHMQAMVHFCRESLTSVLEWCAAVAASSQVEFIIRPRPAVPLEQFQAFVAGVMPDGIASIHVTKAESVREWILASQVVVSSYSTSLIESAVAGQATFMVEPQPMPAVLVADWQSYLPHLTTFPAFESACRDGTPQSGQDLNRWTRARMLSRGDAIENLARFLADLRGGAMNRPRLRPGSLLPPGRGARPAWLEFENLRRSGQRARRTADPNISPLYESDLVSAAEIHHRVQRWGQVLAGRQPELATAAGQLGSVGGP